MKTLPKVALLAVAQLALVGFAVAPQVSARVLGEEYQLRVAPIDPLDPFRGAYVQLDYPDLRATRMHASPLSEDESDAVYVVLAREGDVWVAAEHTSRRPEDGPYLACTDLHWNLDCGIESLFLPQDEAMAMERDLSDGAVATVRIDSRGNAALMSVD